MKKISTLFLSFALVLCFAVSGFAASDAFHDAIDTGNKEYAAGAYEKALAAYNQASQIEPTSPLAWMFKAGTLMKLNQTGAAEVALDKFIDLEDTTLAIANYEAALMAKGGGDMRLVAKYASEAVKLDPTNDRAAAMAAEAYYSMKDYRAAAAAYKKVTEQVPNNPVAWIALAMSSKKAGDEQTAAMAYAKAEEVRKIAVEKSTVLSREAFDFYKQGDWQQSIALYTKAIKANPFFVDARYNRALAYLKTNELAKADFDFEVALKLAAAQGLEVSAADVAASCLHEGKADLALKYANLAVIKDNSKDARELRSKAAAMIGK